MPNTNVQLTDEAANYLHSKWGDAIDKDILNLESGTVDFLPNGWVKISRGPLGFWGDTEYILFPPNSVIGMHVKPHND